VQESIADRVLEKLKFRLQSIYVGNPLDKNTDIGAINSKKQLESIEKYLAIGLAEGAEMYQPECTLPSQGFYCKPTLFTDVAQSARIAQEEIFGPVLTIQTFRTMEEVLQKANNSPYGLAAGVWTANGARIFGLSSQLQAGVVWANTYNKFDPASPFGGYKESGFGREGGRHGLSAYLKFSN
jgi:aldehyde dehydrogenase (NAD+)